MPPRIAPPPPILPVGTQVVSQVAVRNVEGHIAHPRGAVGVIVAAPSDAAHAYRVRFPDDFQCSLGRGEIAWPDVERRRQALHAEFTAALASTRLPDQPDYFGANALLVEARRAALADALP